MTLNGSSKITGMSKYHVILGSYCAEGREYSGDTICHKVEHFPKEMINLKGHLNIDVNEYTKYYAGKVMREISKWPRMKDARHYQRMKETYPDANPALWNIQQVPKFGFEGSLVAFGVFDWRPLLKSSIDEEKMALIKQIKRPEIVSHLMTLSTDKLKSLIS